MPSGYQRSAVTTAASVAAGGRDHATEARKIELDAEYPRRASLAFDARIIALTAWRVVRRDGVSH